MKYFVKRKASQQDHSPWSSLGFLYLRVFTVREVDLSYISLASSHISTFERYFSDFVGSMVPLCPGAAESLSCTVSRSTLTGMSSIPN
jgi:hypothetical protein